MQSVAQVLFAQVGAALAAADDLFLLGEGHQLALGVLELEPQLLQAVFEVGLGVGRGIEAALEVGGDEGLGQRVGRALRERRVRAVWDENEAQFVYIAGAGRLGGDA